MKDVQIPRFSLFFHHFSNSVTRLTGRPIAFLIALGLIAGWAISGPMLDYSNTWQLAINTTTTIVTFLMVFVIQYSQNKETTAMQIKLNELIACEKKASNRLIDVEDLTNEELEVLKKFYVKLSQLSARENDLHSSHSIDEADAIHKMKKQQERH